MFASPMFESTAAFVRRAASLIAIMSTVTLAACGDDGDGGTGPGGSISGMWTAEEDGVREYVYITSETITIYSDFGGTCFTPIEFDIIERDGNDYTIEFMGETATVEITRNGDTLTVDDGSGSFVYTSSSVEPNSLEICDDTDPVGEFDPSLSTCTSYDPLVLGVADGGTLSNTDATDANGFHFDAYRLQVTSASTVEITQTSGDLDSFLYLYNSSGTLIGWDDDTGAGVDALLTEDVGAGCYIVVATSYDPGETGSYVIEANAF